MTPSEREQVRAALERPSRRERRNRDLELRISLSSGRLERIRVDAAMRESEARAHD